MRANGGGKPASGKLGPGKIALLEAIERLGSISAAGRHFKMSYRRAWELVDDITRTAGTDIVVTSTGGSSGGGSSLTETGKALVQAYRAAEAAARTAAQPHLDRLSDLTRTKP